MAHFLTTREVADIYLVPQWRIRRIVDAMQPPVDRFGLKRMIPAGRLVEIASRLQARSDHKGASDGR